MGESWHNFLFAAYDPAATLIIDKPPLALWLQVAFTKAFGFEGTSLIWPMALAGTLAAPLAFGAARRSLPPHGIAAGLLAAMLLAVLPESVATARDSTMDALMMAAVEGRNGRLLIAWAVLMGVIFNVKYFEGFVVMPAAALYIALRWRGQWRARLPLVVRAATTVVAVSLLWVVFVEFTPAAERPLVMNDRSNSVVSLVARYNGIERVLPGDVTIFVPHDPTNESSVDAYARVAAHFGVGNAGPARLFVGANGPLLGMPAAVALLGVAVVLWRRRDWLDGPGAFWITWALTGVLLFSFSNRAAAHYTESYAPALAVLGAVGLIELWRARLAWRGAVVPLATVALLAFAWASTRDFPPIADRTEQLAMAGAVAAAVALLLGPVIARNLATAIAQAVAIGAVLLVPLVTSDWVAFDAPRGVGITRPNPLIYATAADISPQQNRSVPAEVVLELTAGAGSGGGPRYDFAIDGINLAGEAIAYSGASVLPIWSEYERRPVLARAELEAALTGGDVPFVLLGRGRAGAGWADDVLAVVQQHCELDRRANVGRTWLLWRCAGG
jgi:4-amino-4-deoxy-L-arabinose transferase-like glycosyltransferase